MYIQYKQPAMLTGITYTAKLLFTAHKQINNTFYATI